MSGEGNGHDNGKVSSACLPAVVAPSAPVVPSLPAVVSSTEAAATAPKSSVYHPPPRALTLLEAYLTLAGQGARPTLLQLAAAMIPPMKQDALRKWRKANPEADAWVMAELQRRTEAEWPLILRRACELAIKGSIDHMRFFAEVTGRSGRSVLGGSDHLGTPAMTQVVIAVHVEGK